MQGRGGRMQRGHCIFFNQYVRMLPVCRAAGKNKYKFARLVAALEVKKTKI